MVKNILAREGRDSLRSIGAAELVSAAARTFGEVRFRCLPVVDQDQLVGIVTVRDLLQFLAERGAEGLDAAVSEAMTPTPKTVSPSDDIEVVERIFNSSRFNHLPVVEEGKLVGLLTPADILAERLSDVRALAVDLERYITGY